MIKPVEIGNVRLGNNIFLAPMAGVTDLPFRLLATRYGAGFTYTEMVSAKGIFYKNENTRLLMELGKNVSPTGIQLFGSEPDILKLASEEAALAGAAVIDINMGCPAPKITKNGEGCVLMGNPSLAGKIVKAVVSGVNIPVTVKIRKGINENKVNAVEIAKIAEANGASAVCVHGRTMNQFYSGQADLSIIAEVKKNVDVPVIGNGDVSSLAEAESMLAQTGCDAVMIGRAACGNPWVFSGQKAALAEKKEVMAEHAIYLAEFKGEYTGVREMRKHLGWYIKGLKNAARLKVSINSAETLQELLVIIRELE